MSVSVFKHKPAHCVLFCCARGEKPGSGKRDKVSLYIRPILLTIVFIAGVSLRARYEGCPRYFIHHDKMIRSGIWIFHT